MKRIINITALSFFILGLLSCGDEFLDKNDPSVLSFDKLYKNQKDFDAALAGCYYSFQNLTYSNIYWGDMPSDNIYLTPFQISSVWIDVKKCTYTATLSEFSNFWFNNYTTIQRVNLLLENLPGSPLGDKDKKLMAAEAKFLRAFSYFYLLRMFGGVPLYDRYTDVQDMYDVPRASIEEMKNFIISDLEEAKNIDLYRSSGDKSEGRASSTAAKALMAKTYLWVKDFAHAEPVLSELVGSSGLGLEDFDVLYHPDKPINKEIIFSINYERVQGFSFPGYSDFLAPGTKPDQVYPNMSSLSCAGYGLIEHYTAKKFSPDDKRLGLLDTVWNDNNIFSLKYIDRATTSTGLSGTNTIVLRYADVLLMYAEALNENGKTAQAYPHINAVRKRAGIADLPTGYTKEQMFQALADERQKEFLMEGDRWFDLVFRGLPFLKKEMGNYIPNAFLMQNLNIVIRDNCMLFPIPESQTQVKPVLTQNPGY